MHSQDEHSAHERSDEQCGDEQCGDERGDECCDHSCDECRKEPEREVRGIGRGVDLEDNDRKFRHQDRLNNLNKYRETAKLTTSERFKYLAEETGGSSSAGRKMASLLVSANCLFNC